MKYVLVTGGVVSGLVKGVTANSIGLLLQACCLCVTSIKIDPYLNTDAGTMSLFKHEQVFLLDDGGEVVPPDVCVIELGGTKGTSLAILCETRVLWSYETPVYAGDIESMPFIEALGQYRADVAKLLKNLKKELTILVVSHDLKVLAPLVDRSRRMDADG